MYIKTVAYLASLAGLMQLIGADVAADDFGRSDCIADERINMEFADIISGGTSESYTIQEGSCCQETICGLGCPEEVDAPDNSKYFVLWLF
jgi:hypothetical protein